MINTNVLRGPNGVTIAWWCEGFAVDKRTYDAAEALNHLSAPPALQICLTPNEVFQTERLMSKLCLNDVEASVLKKLRAVTP